MYEKIKLFTINSKINIKPYSLALGLIFCYYTLNAQPPNYNFGKQILIDPGQVSGTVDLTNFVLLVDVTDPNLRSTSNGGNVENNNGYDIIFTQGDCSTVLNHQIESYDPTTGEFIAWVRIPTLFANANTNIHMYYGNSLIATDPSTTAVWGAEYAAVYHMNQTPAGPPPQITDFTSNSNDGNANGGMGTPDLVNAQIGQGIDFDGSNDFIDCGSDVSTDPIGDLTVSAWIYSRAASGHIINRGGGWNDPGYSLFHHANNIRIELQRAGEKDIVDNGISINTWHYVALTYDQSTGRIRCFIDGIEQGNTGTHTGPIGNPVENLNIGRKEQNAFYFNGIIDEGRVIHALRNNHWMLTEYRNQSSPSTFYTISAEFSAADLCILLPIELIDFTAILKENVVHLDWQTASETNNDYFTIERSQDLQNWELIATIDGAGNSTSTLSYSAQDFNPLFGTSYYRLKQTDFDGNYEYFEIQSIDYSAAGVLSLYPNPFNNSIKVQGPEGELEDIRFMNTLGQDLTSLVYIKYIGENEALINTSKIRSGSYLIVTSSNAVRVIK